MEKSFRMTRSRLILALLFLTLSGSVMNAAQKSMITIHVGKTGMFSGFGHNHTVTAPVSRATIDPKNPSVEIVVISKELKVVDTEVSDSDRAKIQSTMLGPDVLDSDKYPEIRFKSTRIQQTSPQHYQVTGTLALHGTMKQIAFEVSGTPDHYQGKTKLNQTDFGIKPVSVVGGTVKVKDQLELEFDIYPGEFSGANHR
jgi:polyisoprenoid-binding protein YceI